MNIERTLSKTSKGIIVQPYYIDKYTKKLKDALYNNYKNKYYIINLNKEYNISNKKIYDIICEFNPTPKIYRYNKKIYLKWD